jgi:hypothetical protein
MQIVDYARNAVVGHVEANDPFCGPPSVSRCRVMITGSPSTSPTAIGHVHRPLLAVPEVGRVVQSTCEFSDKLLTIITGFARLPCECLRYKFDPRMKWSAVQ